MQGLEQPISEVPGRGEGGRGRDCERRVQEDRAESKKDVQICELVHRQVYR